MATPASLHTAAGLPTNEQVERNPRSFIDDLRVLLDQQLDPKEFYAELIKRLSEYLGAVNTAVWLTDKASAPELVCQNGLDHQTLFRGEATLQQHLRLVSEVFTDRRDRSIPLVAAASEPRNQSANNYVLHLQPVVTEGRAVAVIQVVQWERNESQQVPWLLAAVGAIASSYHHLREVQSQRDVVRWTAKFEEFVRVLHASLNPREITGAIAQHGPQLLDCDRLLVSLRKRRRFRVIAVTGQTTVHRRANAVRLAERLMKVPPSHDQIVQYPDRDAVLSPREDEAFETYLDKSHAKTVAVCFFSEALQKSADEQPKKRPTLGGFIAEKYDGAPFTRSELSRIELVGKQSSEALRNANQYHQIFLLPVWRALGWLSESLRIHFARSLLLLSMAAGLVYALFYVPADFDLVASGAMQPQQRRDIFARIDGTIDELLVNEGQQVAKDQVLARLTNPDLDLQLEKVVGELRTTNEKLGAIKASRLVDRGNDRSNASTDRGELASQEGELRQWLASLREQQSLIEKQRLNLEVHAPFAGRVLTSNIDPKLRYRPVRRGQLLMTVAELDGPWVLELNLADRNVGHLLKARDQSNQPLEVTFTAATNPNQRIVGVLQKADASIQQKEQEGPSLLLTVGFDRKTVAFLQPGATVTAKIHCGRRSLGYVWLHEIWEFLQYRVFFRF